ncbi:unnamed protein product [Dibothriocephalus latus]|uniref:Uncharacterized protein n=1 Tax=Dibothriocephalus latus TaxID=60516 RepID=A0A3P7LHD3_DIBLA|nr:unnamed protein product [Dibothriocephalus latus]
MEWSMNPFAYGCINFVLAINAEKTVIKRQPALSAENMELRVNVNGIWLATVNKFANLECTISKNIKNDDSIANLTCRFGQDFEGLHLLYLIAAISRSGSLSEEKNWDARWEE